MGVAVGPVPTTATVAVVGHAGKSFGLLAIGSSDAGHYASDTGTLFLEFCAEVLARRLVDLAGG